MAFIDFRKVNVYLLNGFEAAAFVNNYLHRHDEDIYGETDIDEAIGYGIQSLFTPLCNDVFGDWAIEPAQSKHRYSVEDIKNERYSLYYVEPTRYDIRTALNELFNEDWLRARSYVLRYTER